MLKSGRRLYWKLYSNHITIIIITIFAHLTYILNSGGQGDWSTSGCNLTGFDNSTNIVECECNHLTNFACLVVSECMATLLNMSDTCIYTFLKWILCKKSSIIKAKKDQFYYTVWMETQRQTNSEAITVGGQKPMLDNSMDKDRIAWCT